MVGWDGVYKAAAAYLVTSGTSGYTHMVVCLETTTQTTTHQVCLTDSDSLTL